MSAKSNQKRFIIIMTFLPVLLFVVAIILVLIMLYSISHHAIASGQFLPSPNAYDYYMSAGNEISNRTKLLRTYDYICLGLADRNSSNTLADTIDNVIKVNSGALKKLRTGFRYKYFTPPGKRFHNEVLPISKDLCRLLVVESQACLNRNDIEGALQCCMDGMKIGYSVRNGGIVNHELVGITDHSLVRLQCQRLVNRLNPDQCKHFIELLLDMEKNTSLKKIIEEEKLFGITYLNLSPPEYILKYMGIGCSGTEVTKYVTQMNCQEKVAQMKYPEVIKIISGGMSLNGYPNVCELLTPDFCMLVLKSNTSRVKNDLLLISLALRAYKLEHSVYPKTLCDLSVYIKKLPDDPFIEDGTYKYRQTKNGYLLYSAGPDGKDNFGKPIDARVLAGYYGINQDNTGDITSDIM